MKMDYASRAQLKQIEPTILGAVSKDENEPDL